MLKNIRFLVIAVIISVFCTGCVPAQNAISSWEVSVIKIIKPNYIPEFTSLVNEFTEANSDVLVKFVDAPQSTGERHQLYVSALSGRDETIDLYWINNEWTDEFAEKGYILPINGEIPIDNSSYVVDAQEMFSFENKLYALPVGLDMDFIFFRRDAMQQSPGDWDGIMSECRRSDLPFPLSLCVENLDAQDILYNVIEIKNSKNCSYSEALNIYKEIISDNNIGDDMPLDHVTAFKTGNAAMLMGNAALWNKLNRNTSAVKGNISMDMLPGGGASYIRGYGLAVNANSENKEAAIRFLDFMNSKEKQKRLSRECSVMPINESLYEDAMIIDANPYIKDMKDVVKNMPTYESLKICGESSKQAEEVIIKYLNDEETAGNAGNALEILLAKGKENKI